MRRYLILAAAALFAVFSAVVILSVLNRPTATDYRFARGRSQLFTENYLAALATLRDIPVSGKYGPEAHSYLGAAYLKLHLYQAAIREFQEAVKLQPKASDPWIGLASSYIELGDAQKAVDQATKATEVENQSLDAWIALGRAQWQQSNFAEAERAALKARELDSASEAVSDLLLHIYFDQNDRRKFQAELDRISRLSTETQDLVIRFFVREGNFAKAHDWKTRNERQAVERSIIEAELALKRDPAQTELMPQLIRNLVIVGRYNDAVSAAGTYTGPAALDLELGKSYWMMGRKDEAIRAFERASAGRIHKLSAEVALALITGDIRRWEEAYRAERIEKDYFILARLESVLQNPSPLVRAFAYRYAGIYEASFYNNAAQEALKALNDDPKNFDALMTIATAYQRLGRIDDASHYVELARGLYPKSGEPSSRLASLALLGAKPDPDRVLQLMETAVRLEPNNAGYLYNLGWAYDQLGRTAQASELYERAIRASPLTFEAMNNLALIYSNAGQIDRALPLLQRAIRTDPENEAVYANAANYYARLKDWKQALDFYDRALSINPAGVVSAVEKGRIYLEEEGDAEKALDSLSRALEIDPHSFDAYMLLSSAYERMGHVREAIAAAEEARRIRPDAPEVGKALDQLNSAGSQSTQ